ncbi:hypothetical protein EUTSA_v10001772mg [Eutrema salsugineum]|uniref:Uncharacterized protein n=1 Tax=Eutrema salsugineum TaxID=72664 RepID=V4LGN3_EUTSA|nr:uncharacterized protein LOC18015794 [Eutrema salsugineum]ESQ38943.1 hypothetical protein EUTSA_v10001772mg [Eutrema salsugineum]
MVKFGFLDSLRNIWPFSIPESISDMRESRELVSRLSVPESTKNFVFAIRVPEHDSTIYILSAQNLSQRSVTDAECLIREIRPDAVVAQLNNSGFGEALVDESVLLGDSSTDYIPTSVFKVVKQCFVDKVNEEHYKIVAGNLVLREIFGTSVKGHLLAAKRMAEEVGSSFLVLESPFVMQGLAKCLIPQDYGSAYFPNSIRFLIANDAHMPKLLPSHITSRCLANEVVSNEIVLSDTDVVPPFAESIYCLLVHLHDIYKGQKCIKKALASARKMLCDVNRGEFMDPEVISDVYYFQIAVEGIRIGLNNAGRLNLGWSSRTHQVQFSQLSCTDKAYALMADHLRSQAKKFKKIVAVVDACNLAGLRRHWRTCVPQEVKDMSDDCDSKLKRLLSGNKPVGAGALSLSKAISASPFFKILTLKAPAPSNLFLTQSTHKAMSFAFTKMAYPSSQVTAPVFPSSRAKTTSLLKAYLIGAVTQSIIFSAEKTSFSAMGAAFSEIMRKRGEKPIGALPLATFGASLGACAGLLCYEKRIKCAAVSLPSAPSIAKLGLGIQKLREASLEVRSRENNRIHNTIEALRHRLNKFTLFL